ncbi:MAG: sigma 54-interacting transcriptional regulator [Peptococcaceae bacterium]
MRVKQVMYDRPETLHYSKTIADALEVYKRNQVNCSPIINDDKQVVGILTVFRVLDSIKAGANFTTKIADIMDTNLVSVDEDAFFEEVCEMPIERLLVLDKQNKLVGVLTRLELINKVYNAFDSTERELQVILQSIQNGIVAFNTEGIISHFNSAAEQITGFQKDYALGKKIDAIFGGTGLLSVFNKGIGYHKQKLGKSMVIVKSSPILKEGKKLGTVLVIQDISEIEHISQELDSIKTLNKELESIIESSSEGILVTDGKGNVLYENSNFSLILNAFHIYSFKGENLKDYISDEEQEIYELFQRMLKTGKTSSQVLPGLCGRELIITTTPIKDDNHVIVRTIFNFKDMSEINRLRDEAARNFQELRALRAQQFADGNIIIQSAPMVKLLNQVKRIAAVDSTVLITGESGVGKEVIAKQIHLNSLRANEPFIQINCGAIPDNLLESELFGYEKGAFTGASREGKIGMFEVADQGTLLLDEIGEMPQNLQVKLLRVLQEQEIYRIGGIKPVKLNVRILAATNKELEVMVREKKFREDLYYRLNVVPIKIMPLRERKEDILPLAIHFLGKVNQKYNRNCKLSQETCYLLEQYSWPGNVRELINIIERLVIMSEDHVITPNYLPETFGYRSSFAHNTEKDDLQIMSLHEARENMEAVMIKKALEKYGSLRPAGKALGISHSTLLRKARHYAITVQE